MILANYLQMELCRSLFLLLCTIGDRCVCQREYDVSDLAHWSATVESDGEMDENGLNK